MYLRAYMHLFLFRVTERYSAYEWRSVRRRLASPTNDDEFRVYHYPGAA